MGGAYSTIAADVAARWQRMRGRQVRFVTGTDEHGEKIAESAAAAGVTPKAHCDRIAQRYKALWLALDISYTSFVRTTDAKHEAIVRALLASVWQQHVYRAKYSGKYCVGCEEYKDDEDMDEAGNCLIHRRPCVQRDEDNYFFSLSKQSDAVQAYVAEKGRVLPERGANEVKAWIADGCRDFSISRSQVAWGIPVPEDDAQTVYVWFDALIGYLSALLEEGQDPTPKNLAAAGWPADVHIIGKDILRFHAVYWPGMLLAMGLPLPGAVYGHGFLTKDGTKMGKSLGNVLEPFELVEDYGCDAVRFYFMKEIAFGSDGDFNRRRFVDVVNAALANNLGNLTNRCLGLLKKNCGSAFPAAAHDVAEGHPLRAAVEASRPAVAAAYDAFAFHDAVQAALSITGRANQLLEESAPWTALKKGSDEDKAAAGVLLVAALECARIAAVMLAPVVPSISCAVRLQLGEDVTQALQWEESTKWGGLQAGTTFPKPAPVFQRLELLEDAAVAA